jgi:hypothetical protein
MPYKNKVQQKEAQRRHYLANKQKYRAARKRNRDARNIWFLQIKSKLFCKNCSCKDWRCLDFHHRDAATKADIVSAMVAKGLSEKSILAEIAKCDVLCANCHHEHHFGDLKSDSKSSVRKWFKLYKDSLQCESCGLKKPVCLVFHHMRDKADNLNALVKCSSMETVLAEIAKCQVLCCNCHRIAHNGFKSPLNFARLV